MCVSLPKTPAGHAITILISKVRQAFLCNKLS